MVGWITRGKGVGAGYNHGARGDCPGKGDRVEEKSKEEMQNLWTPDE